MYNKNPDHNVIGGPPMSPRISFSTDFVESSSSQQKKAAYIYGDAPVSSDFEFPVNNFSTMTVDELLFKGKLLPFKGNATTLRDELRNQDDNDDFSSKQSPKNPTRLRGFFGIRKPYIGPKKSVPGFVFKD